MNIATCAKTSLKAVVSVPVGIRLQELPSMVKSLCAGIAGNAVKGHECDPERGERCRLCFGVRMRATAAMAAKLGIRRFTTTLAGSRWKRLDQIREAALEAAALHPGTTYWDQNWRKGGLQERRGEILREENFYNQLWCGCEFSMGHLRERDPSDLPAHMKPYLEALGLTGKG